MRGTSPDILTILLPALLVHLALGPGNPTGHCAAQAVYNTTPDWESSDTDYATGGALVDLDRDGWPDFVVANGNDMDRQNVTVYYNNGDGTFPATPNWSSGDAEYNGHVSIADVDGDGWLDVAVGLTVDRDATATARLYLNNRGTLSSLPDWTSPDELAAFQIAFGDVNGDGRPDLAVGTGFAYEGSHRWHNYVYLNVGGMLESSPSWVSSDTWDYWDILFGDVNQDGWLDLIGVGAGTDTWVYLNDQGTLASTAAWRTTDDPNQVSLGGTYGDLSGDGLPELFIAGSIALGGSGFHRRYDGLPEGLFTTSATWTIFEGYGSVVSLADLDADGDLDLTTGGWWGYTRYFLNTDGLLPSSADWSSADPSVVETITCGDVNKDGLRRATDAFDVTAAPGRHLFQLSHQPIEGIDYVTVDGQRQGPEQFTFDPVHGWVSVGADASAAVAVHYVYTLKPDMAVTNWDNDLGNYLYYNLNDAVRFGDFNGDGDVNLEDFMAYPGCLAGPDVPVAADCAEVFDANGDGDVDMADYMEWHAALIE